MALIVQKYGGTSVGTTDRIHNVAKRIASWKAKGNDLVVVVSAMSGETNRLIALAKEMQANPDPRELDVVMATGEQVTIGLLVMALKAIGIEATSYCGWQVQVVTDEAHGKSRIQHIDHQAMRADLDAGHVVVVAGFQGVTEQGKITTLGRGGSDTSAVALAAALKADECQIYTDVDGVYTTDPRIEPKARRLETIDCAEMIEMASLGSKVLHIRSVEFAGKYKVKLRVLSSFDDEGKGTLITFEENKNMEKAVITGIAFDRNEALINIKGASGEFGIAYQVLSPILSSNIELDMINQTANSDGSNDFSFTVSRGDLHKVEEILARSKAQFGNASISTNQTVGKISVVGIGMRSHCEVIATMLNALNSEGINPQLISTSEIKLSALINEQDIDKAVRALHQAFALG